MKGMKCVACGKTAKPATLRVDKTAVPGWKCASCGEEYLDGAAVETLLAVRKLKTEHLTAKVSKQGNSYSIRVPMKIVDAYHLKDKKQLKILPEESRIVLEI
jgi:ribosomal protein L37AE/L43A